MKLLKLCFALLFLSAFNFSSAQTPAAEEVKIMPQPLTIENPQVFRQDDKGFEIGMTVKGGEAAISDVIVGISLVNVAGKSGKTGIYDTRVYRDEKMLIKPGSALVKKFYYELPPGLSGKFRVAVNLYNTYGMFLAQAQTDEVTFKAGSVSMPVILADTCSLIIAGEKKTPYNLTQGVPLDSSEVLSLECRVKNVSEKAITVTPSFSTHRRNTYTVSQSAINGDPLSFAAKEEKTVSLILPVPVEPQAYDIVISLLDSAQGITSNSVASHFVVRGMSGTIQAVSLDKSLYEKGDIANISFSVAGPADNFRSPRKDKTTTELAIMEATIALMSNGVLCADSKTLNLTKKDFNQTVAIPVTVSCAGAIPLLTLKANGNILDSNVPPLSSQEKAKTDKLSGVSDSIKTLFSFMILLLVIGGGMFYWRKSKAVKTLVIAFILLGSGAVLSPHHANASNVSWVDSYGDTHTGSTNKNTYAPGETVSLSATTFAPSCGNPSGEVNWVLDPAVLYIGNGDIIATPGTVTFPAPLTTGTHTIYFSSEVDDPLFYPPWSAYPKLTFTVGSACVPSWTPDVSTVCSGVSFTQTDGCGNTQTAFGTKMCTPPPTVTLTPSPSTVTLGNSSVLTWTTSNATSCSAPWTAKTTTADNESVTPAFTQTYTITCSGPGGTTSNTKTVTVSEVPNVNPNDPMVIPSAGNTNTQGVAQSFTISATDPDPSAPNNQVKYEIDWNMDGAVDQILPPSGYVNSGTPQDVSHTWPVAGNNPFQVRTEDEPGLFSNWKLETASIMYLNFVPFTSSVVISSGRPTLSWDSSNTNTCNASAVPEVASWSGPKEISGTNALQDPLLTDTTYTLTCTNTASGISVNKSVLVTVSSMPVVTFTTPTSLPVAPGTQPVLKWDSTNADTCTASAVPPTASWSGTKPFDNLAGETESPITVTTDYTIVCQNTAAGASSNPQTLTIPVSTLCGSADGVMAFSEPTSNLCVAGATPSTPVEGGTAPNETWNWTCTSASWVHNCKAPKGLNQYNQI